MPDEPLRPVARRRQPRDRDRRGRGADHRFRLERRANRGEDLALDLFLLGRRFDHQVAIAQLGKRVGRDDALERGFTIFVGDALAADLPRQISVDGGNAYGNPLDGDVVEQNIETGQRANMRDAVAHLTRADYADLADFGHGIVGRIVTPLRPFFYIDHLRLLSTLIPFSVRPVSGRVSPAPAPIPAAPDKGPPPVRSRLPERSELPHPC